MLGKFIIFLPKPNRQTIFFSILIALILFFSIFDSNSNVSATIVASIAPDGQMDDWSSVTSAFSDPDEHPSCHPDHFDIKEIWISNQLPGSEDDNDYYIYFRWDRYDNSSASASLEIPIDTDGDFVQNCFLWIDVSSSRRGAMNVKYALYQGSPSTAEKSNPIIGTSESYVGPGK